VNLWERILRELRAFFEWKAIRDSILTIDYSINGEEFKSYSSNEIRTDLIKALNKGKRYLKE